MKDYWLENAADSAAGKQKHILVDLGYLSEQAARDRADKLFTKLSKTNLRIVGASRIVIRVPPNKLAAVLAAFPEITTKQTYSWCSHSWVSAEGASVPIERVNQP